VEETGKKLKKWREHYFVYERSANDREVRKHRIITLGLKSELRKWEAQNKLKQIIDRETGGPVARPDSEVTLRWFWENRFLPLQVHWRESTREGVLFMMNRYVLPKFGDMALANLRRFDLQTHLNALAKKYSQSVVHKARTWVRATLEEAVEQEFLAKNPARKLTMPPTRDTCKRYLTKAEYQRLLEELRGRDRLILRLFVLCAFRPGELFALRWRCFANGCLRVEEAVYQGKIGTPKTKGSAAEVVLPRSLAEELAQWYEESNCPDPDALIFPSSKNKPIDGHNYLRRDVLRPAAERVGIRGITFHPSGARLRRTSTGSEQ